MAIRTTFSREMPKFDSPVKQMNHDSFERRVIPESVKHAKPAKPAGKAKVAEKPNILRDLMQDINNRSGSILVHEKPGRNKGYMHNIDVSEYHSLALQKANEALEGLYPKTSDLKKIGDYIAHEESGPEGILNVDYDSTGGTSYGKWQLSSRNSYKDWIAHLEDKGGKYAEIARELKAAGPYDTGSRRGRSVEVYKRLARENPEIFEETQHETLMKIHYAQTLESLKSDKLRDMIKNDRALQEMMFSTAVQHGPDGASRIFNKVYNDKMDREDFIKGVYAKRARCFPSSSIDVQNSVKERFKREAKIILAMNPEIPRETETLYNDWTMRA